ncbi:uncharacterized protein LOC122653648 isoform X2 [Telopea speciosissima]|uniref:uncharacterized protein LOC122653648 isoform X2 n=1 Tax=Telopea speciosissima TaxID=54955 RepID=UPI001CC69660|nr:uncharacterized protein LOC122653648 isoform X2 [Telopea speciosissima]
MAFVTLNFRSLVINFSSAPAIVFNRNSYPIPHTLHLKRFQKKSRQNRPLTVSFALAESESPGSLNAQSLLQELADSFVLPPDYLAQLPDDLRIDCGQELGEILLNLSRSWELADTSTSCSIVSKLPSLEASLTNNAKSAFGKRLVSAGRRFQSMGQYGQGELQRIAKVMIKTGRLLSANPMTTTDEQPKQESRMFKFGELQVELTSNGANIGAAIGFAFGILSWELSQGIQSIPESSLQYANDNALLLAKSLRGALLAICYSSTLLSAFASVGLILLGIQLKSKEQQ